MRSGHSAIQIAFLFLFGSIGLQAQCGKHIAALINDPPGERTERLKSLYEGGTKAIPLLIDQIADGGLVSTVSLAKPTESIARMDPVYCGTVSAYLIELIIGTGQFSIQSSNDFFLGVDPSNYVYRFGIVTTIRDHSSIRRTDLRKLKLAYLKWWVANQAKRIEELRSDWKDGRRPLSGSDFLWE